MTMTSPDHISASHPIPVPTLTVLPPSSDTESWSRSPSPRQSRCSRHSRSHRTRTRTKKPHGEEEAQGCSPIKRQWSKSPKMKGAEDSRVEDGKVHQRSPSPSKRSQVDEEEPGGDRLLPPSRSWSRSPSPSRRSRWSLKSLLGRDSDWDSCRLVSRLTIYKKLMYNKIFKKNI